jgi:hypothetical protein
MTPTRSNIIRHLEFHGYREALRMGLIRVYAIRVQDNALHLVDVHYPLHGEVVASSIRHAFYTGEVVPNFDPIEEIEYGTTFVVY